MIPRSASTLALAIALSLGLAGQQPDPRVAQARQQMQAGKFSDAIATLQALLAEQPDNAQIHFWMGQAQLFAGEAAESIPHLEIALTASGGSGAVQFVLGQAYLEVGRLTDADAALTVAMNERPQRAQIHLFRGAVCYQAGRLEAADRFFARAAELQPQWELPVFRRATLALDQKRPQAALQLLEQAAQLAPEDSQLLLIMATARSDLQQPDKALELVTRAATMAPDFEPAQTALMEQLDRIDRTDELLAEVDEVLRRWPDQVNALYYRAYRRSLRGELEGALEDAERAVRHMRDIPPTLQGIHPGDVWRRAGDLRPRAMHLRADLLARLGRTTEATQAARQLTREHPDFADGFFLLGSLLRRGGDASGAQAALRRFKALSDARTRRSGADTLLAGNHPERARAAYESALEANPRDAAALIGLATSLRREGAPGRAVETLQGARGIGASVLDWYREWILSLAAAGRREEAAAAFAESRRMQLQLTPEVWAAVVPLPPGCTG